MTVRRPEISAKCADLVTAARDLAPEIAAAVPTYRGASDLPVSLVAAMKEAGLHKSYMPRRYGGYELDWGAHYYISREIAQVCGSAGWIAGLVFTHVMCLGRFPERAQDAFFTASPDGILATASAGAGVLERVPGGMRLSGRWGWASGVRHAGGLMVIAKEGEGPLFTHFCLLLPGEYTIENTWDSAGLHATGSHHVKIVDQFIPDERLVERDVYLAPNPPGSEIHSSYVYRLRPAPLQKSYFMGPLLGTAKGALKATVEQTAKRRGQIVGEKVAVQTPVQVNLGVATAEIDAATLVFDEYVRRLHAWGVSGQDISPDDLLWGKRNVTFASRLCLSAADRLSAGLGAGGQLQSNPVPRLYTDCRSITTHVELHWDHSMAPTGMLALGLPTGDPLIDGGATDAKADRVIIGTQI
ncbi:acyl-CoA dehydrogenase family protein [Asticcacaulis sp.]|uniref:acyl-CoA dehydrogenase family protein n=1 Tax=Asticcacaulis sp. TaxID=1872648 RepID=UPI002615BEC4|nr:acyl-CoA dehydrogenase family protein [Asticcacaulis sp.]